MSNIIEMLNNAIKEQDKNTVKAIIATGVDLNKTDDVLTWLPLHSACAYCSDEDTEIITLLLNAGADPSNRDFDDNTVLTYCSSVRAKVIQDFIDKNTSQPTILGLQLIKAGNDIEKVIKLIAEGADINTVDHTGATALGRLASSWAYKEIYDKDGTLTDRKPIHDEKAYAVMQLLLQKGANPNLTGPGSSGYTPLIKASRIAALENIKLLVEYGADINAETDRPVANALIFAAETGHFPTVKYLVEQGVSTERTLKYAKGGKKVKEYLISHGAT